MKQSIALITLVVKDYDEAIDFYVNKLKFDLLEDIQQNELKRWVRIGPKGQSSISLLLARADGDEQKKFIGNQTGGRVFLFLYTDDFKRDYQNLLDNNIEIEREPVDEPYGTVAVFKDLYGNLWDLIQPK